MQRHSELFAPGSTGQKSALRILNLEWLGVGGPKGLGTKV